MIYLLFIRKKTRKKELKKKEKSSFRASLNSYLNSKITKSNLGYAACCAGIFLGFYFSFALFFSFALHYPHSLLAIALVLIYFPIIAATEIFYRKMLYPSLEFIKSRKNQTYIISTVVFSLQIFLIFQLGYMSSIITIAAGCAFLFSSLMNCIIYHKTGKLGPAFLNSFIVCGIFFGDVWSFYLDLIALTI